MLKITEGRMYCIMGVAHSDGDPQRDSRHPEHCVEQKVELITICGAGARPAVYVWPQTKSNGLSDWLPRKG